MRILLILALVCAVLLLTGCDYGFTFHPEQMTPDQMLQRADLVFIGVVEGQHVDSWPFFRVPIRNPDADDLKYWRPLRRRVRVETVLRGSNPGNEIDVYEIYWLGGTTGDWNSLHNNARYLFMVRKENGRWRIVRDWHRSVYEVNSGYHARLPLDESHSFWERYALMNYWIAADEKGFYRMLAYHVDPGSKLDVWRHIKLQRGLLRHPQFNVRLAACSALWNWETGDGCAEQFSIRDWKNAGFTAPLPTDFKWDAAQVRRIRNWFSELLDADVPDLDVLRIFTVVDHPALRREFCQKFMAKFPNDTDNGCPADKPLPATIVTENGDVPLVGPWPK